MKQRNNKNTLFAKEFCPTPEPHNRGASRDGDDGDDDDDDDDDIDDSDGVVCFDCTICLKFDCDCDDGDGDDG